MAALSSHPWPHPLLLGTTPDTPPGPPWWVELLVALLFAAVAAWLTLEG